MFDEDEVRTGLAALTPFNALSAPAPPMPAAMPASDMLAEAGEAPPAGFFGQRSPFLVQHSQLIELSLRCFLVP